jgi:ribonuclease P protein component
MQNFPKAERLSGEKNIEELYKSGDVLFSYPFKVFWKNIPVSDAPAKVVISVPKRSFKKAVERNKIKRRIREAYRKNKSDLYKNVGDKKMILLLIYTAKTIEPYSVIETRTKVFFQKLSEAVSQQKSD